MGEYGKDVSKLIHNFGTVTIVFFYKSGVDIIPYFVENIFFLVFRIKVYFQQSWKLFKQKIEKGDADVL